ncbi:MAG: glycosyltransferase family 39 protein [Saprospiraceae bacterium]|nr:glycosyltransferase family 39 protein [Saprospiraceae bacterium]
MQKSLTRLFTWFIFGALLYFPLFLHLDYMPIRNYDEARLAVNALELGDSQSIFVTTFKGEPDSWNTKPPIMVWCQAACIKIFGTNELAIRLPAALAGLATCLLLFWFCIRILRKELAGFLSAILLVSCAGFTTLHVTRTGDYDAFVVLFLTAQVLFGFAWTERPHKKIFLWLAAGALALAVLSKSVIGLLFLFPLGLYMLLRREGRQLLREPTPYLAFGSALLVILAYYLLREQLQPGYLQAVWENELGGRYLETLESHDYPFSYYLNNMWNGRFWPMLLFLPFALLWNAFQPEARFSWLAIWVASVFLIFISLSQTKIYWYDAPVYPLLSLIIGLAIADLIHLVNRLVKPAPVGTLLLSITFLGYPYRQAIERVYFPDYRDYNGWQDNVYRDAMRKTPADSFTVAKRTEEYSAHLLFYREAFAERGQKVFLKNIAQLSVGEEALICGSGKGRLKEMWQFEVTQTINDCVFVRILARQE